MSPIDSLVFFCRRSVCEGSCKTSPCRRLQTGCTVVLRGRRCVESRFLWQAQHVLRSCQKMSCLFRGTRNTLDTSIVISRGKRNTLDVSSCVSFANLIARAASSGDTQHSTLYTFHSTLYTPHFTIHTLHCPLCTHTLHSTLYLHFTLYTPHFTLHTPHFTPHTLHSTVYTVHFLLTL